MIEFDYLIVNDDLVNSINAMKSIIIGETFRTKRVLTEELIKNLFKGVSDI
jgi:guanylate kinase